MISIASLGPRSGRNVELLLLVGAVGLVMLAYVNVEVGANGSVPPNLLTQGAVLLGIAVAFHLVLRLRATYADPLILPIATLLTLVRFRWDERYAPFVVDGALIAGAVVAYWAS